MIFPQSLESLKTRSEHRSSPREANCLAEMCWATYILRKTYSCSHKICTGSSSRTIQYHFKKKSKSISLNTPRFISLWQKLQLRFAEMQGAWQCSPNIQVYLDFPPSAPARGSLRPSTTHFLRALLVIQVVFGGGGNSTAWNEQLS